MENIIDTFLSGIWGIKEEKISNDITHRVKRCFLDYLGATIAGSKMLGKRGEIMLSYLGNGQGECSVIGFNAKSSLHTASFINGFSSHIAELDDGVISGIVHPGAPVFSALLPVAEKERMPFDRFCIGTIAGYESCVRLANAIQPCHKELGYHATATCGITGATLGIAAMLDFDKEEFKNSFSVALASAHGTLKVLEDDSELKPFNVATASSDGVVAAIVGKAKLTGPNDALNGYSGFFSHFTSKTDYSLLFRDKGDKYCIEDVYMKPYAACRYVHPTIENALKIKRENPIDVANIESIDIKTYALAVHKHNHTSVRNVASAKMSIPFGAAVALCRGTGGMDAYTQDTVTDKEIASLMKKIHVFPSEEYSQSFPEKSIADMSITMKSGKVYKSYTDEPKGEASSPLSDDELKEKFLSLASYAGMPSAKSLSIIKEIFSDNPNICKLTPYLL